MRNLKILSIGVSSVFVGIILCSVLSCSDINTVGDVHFNEDGTYIKDSTDSMTFTIQRPQNIKFFIEVSGSMNGFFRPNLPTDFKTDVWKILSHFSQITPCVTILTDEGKIGGNIPLSDFQAKMNQGAFVSSASTKVPVMLQSIINNLDVDAGEVAVLVSDMKYSPAGAKDSKVLLSQYSSDISRILGSYGKAVCLVAATSNYLDKNGNCVTSESPYFYFIIGQENNVAYMRNCISTLLEINKHFVDNIESGFDYGRPTYSFGIPDNCIQMNGEPTFYDFDTSVSDTCVIKLKVNLENYRWIVADSNYFPETFKVKTLYGSNVKVGNIEYDIKNITDKELKRTATAIVDLKVFDMAQDSEVLEWSFELPDTDDSRFSRFWGALSEDDVEKAFSVDNFIKGIFYGGIVNKHLKPNYILISKNS